MSDLDDEETEATKKLYKNVYHDFLEDYIKKEIERINRLGEYITESDLGARYAYENILRKIWKGN